MSNLTPYQRVVHVSEKFLGPAGEQLIRRQIRTHLGIEPEQLRSKDIPHLVHWARLTFAMLTDDQKAIDNFTASLRALAESK